MGNILHIDGSMGEGGGQVLRTSLALSLVTGKSFEIDRIRAGRSKPGLMRQHLTAVNAAVQVGAADVSGNDIGSRALSFAPKGVFPGNYHFAVGTAGSGTLVLQTILPALMLADLPSDLVIEGGTHNPFAPPLDFLERAFLPLVNRMGPNVTFRLDRMGFFPAGGGKFAVHIDPAKALSPLEITERGEIREKSALALVSKLPVGIAKREIEACCRKLGWDQECGFQEETNRSLGPGNVLTVTIRSEHVTEVFTGFGMKGVTAETVGRSTAKLVEEYLTSGAPVGRYLADQILIPLALADGGRFRTTPLSRHSRTNIEVIKAFLDVDISTEEIAADVVEVAVSRSSSSRY